MNNNITVSSTALCDKGLLHMAFFTVVLATHDSP